VLGGDRIRGCGLDGSAMFRARMASAARIRGGGCAAAIRTAGRLDRGAGGYV